VRALAVTAVLAVVLSCSTWRSRRCWWRPWAPWSPLYLAWLAVPGVTRPPEPAAAKTPAYGRRAGQWHPVQLGVHPVIGGGPMPAHVRPAHDALLEAVLDPAVAARASRRSHSEVRPVRRKASGSEMSPGGQSPQPGSSAEPAQACGSVGSAD
jgi:hypothetical protein